MAVLGQLLFALFSGLVSWLAQFITKKIAIVAVAVAMIATLLAAFRAAIDGALAQLQESIPSYFVSTLDLLPHNVGAVGSAVITAHIACAVYRYGRSVVDTKVSGLT